MKNNVIVAKICALPEQLEHQKNKSLLELLKELNIDRKNQGITTGDIKEYLKNNTRLIESWLLYSINKRTSESWYFIKEDKSTYIVGYLFRDASKKEFKYPNPAQACAVFIYNELFGEKKEKKKKESP